MTPELERLAAAYGVATSYLDQRRLPVTVDDDAVVAVLGALGVDASDPSAVAAAIAEAEQRRRIPPVVVQRQSRPARVRTAGAALLRLEDGTHRAVAVDGGVAVLPAGLPLGWHSLEIDGGPVPVVITPDRVERRERRGWGWMTQLYAMQSDESWGIGDLADLATVVDFTARRGADLLLVNPLHAVAPVAPMPPSPYYPASRRWTNPVYLRIESTSAYAAAPAEVRSLVDGLRIPPATELIDRDAAWAAKAAALELLIPYAGIVDVDDDLARYATWVAIAEEHGADWREWPADLRHPDDAGVAAARGRLGERVWFHAWLQRLCDEQLAEVQSAARAAGMDVGVVHDLAVGADPGGYDAWAWQDVLAAGVRIGAPPDAFNQQGQDWGMPPWHPTRLEAAAYRPLRDLVRSVVWRGGGVRVDHILGMFRVWWIPPGADPRGGTYVRYDAEAMLGIIALEATRAGAVVVGEDLGTVPPEVRSELADRGLLGSSVLWFERSEEEPGETGRLLAAAEWREPALASVTTHDLPTARGWVVGEHVRVRAKLGLLDDPEDEKRSWERERDELLALLVEAGVLDSAEASTDDVVLALHRFVAATPSRYAVAAPGDAVGDLRQPNLPGTVDEYPNWRLPVTDADGRPVRLNELLADPRVARLVDVLQQRVR